MHKSTLTFYLPKETFERAKIAAVKADISFSDLVLGCVLALINHNTFDPQHPRPSNDEKTMIYLAEEEKRKIKLFAASQAASISELFYQALERYMTENTEALPARKKLADGRGRPKSDPLPGGKKKPYSYHLTKANDEKLRTISARTGKTRTRLVLEAVENTAEKDILALKPLRSLSERSNLNLTPEELLFLKEKAERLNISLFQLINRALSLYY